MCVKVQEACTKSWDDRAMDALENYRNRGIVHKIAHSTEADFEKCIWIVYISRHEIVCCRDGDMRLLLVGMVPYTHQLQPRQTSGYKDDEWCRGYKGDMNDFETMVLLSPAMWKINQSLHAMCKPGSTSTSGYEALRQVLPTSLWMSDELKIPCGANLSPWPIRI